MHSPAARRGGAARRARTLLAGLVLLATGVTGCTASSARPATAPSEPTAQQMSAYEDAVRVQPQGSCGRSGSGLTDGRFVLTAASVVAGAATASVTNRSGTTVTARVLSVDPDANVAWLYTPGLPSRLTTPANAGDHIAPAYVFVLATGRLDVLRSARVERTTRPVPDAYGGHPSSRPVFVLHLDARLSQDPTGAPVLDQDGRLLGIAVGGSRGSHEVVTLAGEAIAASSATSALRAIKDPANAPAAASACAPG